MELTRFRIKYPPRTILTLLSQNWLLFPLVVLAFLPTFSNGFQHACKYTWQVIENSLIQAPTLPSASFHLRHFWQGQYSPVNSFFYLAIAPLFGMEIRASIQACNAMPRQNEMRTGADPSWARCSAWPALASPSSASDHYVLHWPEGRYLPAVL